MASRRRPTHNTSIARGLGGRTGFASEVLDRGGRAQATGSRAERVAAGRNWHDAINHFEDYVDDNHFRISRLLPSVELLVAGGCVLLFVGGYAGFIAFLALTR